MISRRAEFCERRFQRRAETSGCRFHGNTGMLRADMGKTPAIVRGRELNPPSELAWTVSRK